MKDRPTEPSAQSSPHLVVQTVNFDTCDESLHTTFWRNTPRADLGPCNVSFVINAPLDFAPAYGSTEVIFYLDSAPRDRLLGSLSYQIIHQANSPREQFADWVTRVMPFLREALLGSGLVCTDFADFRSVLERSSSRQLQCELIDYIHPWKVPETELKALRFKTLFANLFGDSDVSLPMYLELDEALCRLNPSLALHKLGLKTSPCKSPVLLLLGEPDD